MLYNGIIKWHRDADWYSTCILKYHYNCTSLLYWNRNYGKIMALVSSIISKSKKNNKFTSEQINTTIYRTQYFRLTYMDVWKMAPEDRRLFGKCSEDVIEDLIKVGIKFIHSPKIVMKLNRYFRRNYRFPHPNIQV